MTMLIGFATKFYTLWNMEKNPQYIESNGKYYLVGYNYVYSYIKNISTDLETAKSKYPNLSVDDELRGKTQSWTSENKEDLCPQIMKFGKYYGKDLNDIVKSDFNYVLWLISNNYSKNQQYASELPEIKAYYENIENERKNEINLKNSILSEFESLDSFSFIAERNLKIYESLAYICTQYKGLEIQFVFNDYSVMKYNGFEYALPIVNGKSKRIKGNEITLTFERSIEETFGYDIFIVKSILIKK